MTGFLRADASDPQSSVIGVTARDQMTGEEFTIRARRVIDGLRGTHPALEATFDAVYRRGLSLAETSAAPVKTYH